MMIRNFNSSYLCACSFNLMNEDVRDRECVMEDVCLRVVCPRFRTFERKDIIVGLETESRCKRGFLRLGLQTPFQLPNFFSRRRGRRPCCVGLSTNLSAHAHIKTDLPYLNIACMVIEIF